MSARSVSSLIETYNRFKESLLDFEKNPLNVTQFAVTFLLGIVNWIPLNWWVNNMLPKISTFNLDFLYAVLSLAGIFFVTIILAVLGTIRRPQKILIAPFDIELVTTGIIAYQLVTNPNFPIVSDAFLIILAGALLLSIGSIQNSMTRVITGIAGGEDDIHVRVFDSPLKKDELLTILKDRQYRRALGTNLPRDLSDGTSYFFASFEDFECYIGVTKKEDPSLIDKGCTVTLIAFERGRFAIWKNKASALWFESEYNTLLGIKELKLTVSPDQKNFSKALQSRALESTKGFIDRLYKGKYVGRYLRAALIIAITTTVTLYFYFNKTVDPSTTVFILVTIALSQVVIIYEDRDQKKS